MNLDLTLAIALLWLAAAGLSFVNGLMRQFHVWQWLALSLVLGPFALVLSLFLTGRGPEVSLFSRAPRAEAPAFRVPSDEALLSGEKAPFKDEIVELTQSGKLGEAERMLETLLDVLEEKARKLDRGVPHWYYEQLATVHRKAGNEKEERRALERWERLRHASPPKAEARLTRRLEKLRA